MNKYSIRAVLLSSALALYPTSASATDTVVATGTTQTSEQSLGGTDTLTIENNAALSVDGSKAVQWNDPSTDVQITNDGIIESTQDEGRAINAAGSATTPRALTLTNGTNGIIRSQDDAIRIHTDITDTTPGAIHVINAGQIISTDDGQALDFDSIDSAADGVVQIDNEATGTIQSTDGDAIRPGQGAIVTNAGLINAGAVTNDSSDGIDWQDHSGTVINEATGTITGARHGITTSNDVTVTNYGTIIGGNGSGVGSDGSGRVINYGTIIGTVDGSPNGDGDGIDIDAVGYVENYGSIQALGANGTHIDGRPNGSDGVTFGNGGTFINHAGASVFSVTTGIAFGVQATIVNAGTLEAGGTGIGIRSVRIPAMIA